MKTVRISEQELYDICKSSLVESSQIDPMRFNSRLRHEVSKNFNLLTAMEKPKNRVTNKQAHNLILFAAVAFFALTIKMGCENYWKEMKEASNKMIKDSGAR